MNNFFFRKSKLKSIFPYVGSSIIRWTFIFFKYNELQLYTSHFTEMKYLPRVSGGQKLGEGGGR